MDHVPFCLIHAELDISPWAQAPFTEKSKHHTNQQFPTMICWAISFFSQEHKFRWVKLLKCHQKYKQSTVILLDKQIDLFLKSIMVYNMKSCFFKKDRIGKRLIQLLSTSTFVGLYKTWFASNKLTFSTCLTSTKKIKLKLHFHYAPETFIM